jgi:hypothetical protein
MTYSVIQIGNQMSPSKAKPKREDLEQVAIRIEPSHRQMLEELAADDPERATFSTLVRRAIREYLQRQGKIK